MYEYLTGILRSITLHLFYICTFHRRNWLEFFFSSFFFLRWSFKFSSSCLMICQHYTMILQHPRIIVQDMPDSNPGPLRTEAWCANNEPPHLLNEPPHLHNEPPCISTMSHHISTMSHLISTMSHHISTMSHHISS